MHWLITGHTVYWMHFHFAQNSESCLWLQSGYKALVSTAALTSRLNALVLSSTNWSIFPTGCSDLTPSTAVVFSQLFCEWCALHYLAPAHCLVLTFLQGLLDSGKSPSTLKVYMVAHKLVTAFQKTARSLCTPGDVTIVLTLSHP